MANNTSLRKHFKRRILRLLPHQWVRDFRAYEALEFFDLEDFIGMTNILRTEDANRQIMELCIKASNPLDRKREGNTPIAILKAIARFNNSFAPIPRFKPYLAKFDGKLFALTRSNECFDSRRILKLFCTKPARIIQYAWKRYQQKRKDCASRVIQQKVLEWLYRPDGPMMKKSEASFYSIASGSKQ